jgi:hypothetical protein
MIYTIDDLARGRSILFCTSEGMDQDGLAGTAPSYQTQDFPDIDRGADVPQHLAAVKALADIVHDDENLTILGHIAPG